MLTLTGSHVNYLNFTVHSFHAEPCYLNHCQLAKAIDFATMMMITLAKVIVEVIVGMSVLPEIFPTMPTIWFQ
jgi:hypothetical protein